MLRDQFQFLLRAGFDSFEVKKPADARVFAEVLARFSVFYQPGADGRVSALRRRIKNAPAANRAKQCSIVIPGRREAASPESISTSAGVMDSGFLAEPFIGPRDFARARWLGPAMTSTRYE